MTDTDLAARDCAATCRGVKVPQSPFLNETRIRRLNEGRYEHQEIAGALQVVGEKDRVLELGAGLGVVGAVVALNCKPKAVLSFEANPEVVEHTAKLHELNGLDGVIELRNEVLIASPDRPERVTFHIANSILGSSLIDRENRRTRPVEIPTAGFDDVCAKFRPTVLLMDIEGGELDLLQHADLGGLSAVVLEFHPETYGRDGMRTCKSILTKAGFEKVDAVSTRTVWTCRRAG